MNFQNDYTLTLAQPEDEAQILQVFESGSFYGKISVGYRRRPFVLASYQKEGEETIFMVLRKKTNLNQIIGIGGIVIRKGFWKGKQYRIGYLTGLKLLEQYQKQVLFIPQFYEAFHQVIRQKVDIIITTILSENTAVSKMLEKPRKLMPKYQYIGQYHTYFCKAGAKKQSTISRITLEQAEKFYQKKVEKDFLTLPSAGSYDLKNAQFYGLLEKGELIAVGYALNQQHYKQYVAEEYHGIYWFLSKLPTRLFGYPSFPKLHATADCCAGGLWIAKGVEIEKIRSFWKEMLLSVSADFLIFGLLEGDEREKLLQNQKKIIYSSRLYQVSWPGEKEVNLKDSNIHIEVAFL